MPSTIGIVAYLALFAVAGLGFVLINLLIGRFLRPVNPHPEKQAIYECGEPTIGSSFVQFDLRFYVVALVFIVFDVEVAFMFPWATVYGKAVHLARIGEEVVAVENPATQNDILLAADGLYRELGVSDRVKSFESMQQIKPGAQRLVGLAAWAMGMFFFVLLLGFAYEWKTGAMDWVRAVTRADVASIVRAPPADVVDEEMALTV